MGTPTVTRLSATGTTQTHCFGKRPREEVCLADQASRRVASTRKKHTMEDTSPAACRGRRWWERLEGMGGGGAGAQSCHQKPGSTRDTKAPAGQSEEWGVRPSFVTGFSDVSHGNSVICRKSKGGQIMKEVFLLTHAQQVSNQFSKDGLTTF